MDENENIQAGPTGDPYKKLVEDMMELYKQNPHEFTWKVLGALRKLEGIDFGMFCLAHGELTWAKQAAETIKTENAGPGFEI